jgi:RNA polymerase sigma-70 factor (ECF subfamily)
VLEVIYLVFNEGYAASSGDDWVRPELCDDALRLGRILAQLVPNEAEVHGLVALMELQASRSRARTGPDGQPILLLEQDRGRWDQLLVRRGLAALARAWELRVGQVGPYTLQAEIAARHARARRLARRRAVAAQLSSVAERARVLVARARTQTRGAGRVRAGRNIGRQHT